MIRTRKEFEEWLKRERPKQPRETRCEWEEKAWADWFNEMENGDHCHIVYYNSVEPCTVLFRTADTITVRKDNAVLKPKPSWVPGGYNAIRRYMDVDEWEFSENPKGQVLTFQRSKDGKWYGTGMRLFPGWMK